MKRYTRAEVARHGAYVEWVKAHEAEKQRDLLADALRKIASCESMVDGDVVSVARDALRALGDQ